MSMTIGTNISSLNAQRHLASSKLDMENAMERLASGSRINSSRDDAAGLAIAGRMTSQVNGLNQAVRNANDGIALAQSAEGALDETTSILQRMRDLSVQASSSTLTSSDRTSIQSEVTALTSELDRIATTTTFNNISLLDGTAKGLTIQVGAGQGESATLTISGASSSDLGINGTSSANSGALNGGRMTSMATVAGDDVLINGVAMVANTAALGADEVINDAAGNALTALTSTADGMASIINSGTSAHGATATASNSLIGAIATGVTNGAITIGGATIAAANNMAEFVANINNAAGGAMARLNAAGNGVELFNTTGEDIVVAGVTAAVANTGLTAGTTIGSLSLSNTDGTKALVSVGTNSGADPTDANALGFNARTDASTIVSTSVNTATNLVAADDVTMNGISLGPNITSNPSAAALATHLNTYTDSTGVLATARTEVTMNMKATTAAGATSVTTGGAFLINGTSTTLTTGTIAANIVLINASLNGAGQSIVASQGSSAGDIILTSESGTTIEITDANGSVSSFTNSDGDVQGVTTNEVLYGGQLTLTNTSGGDITFGTVNGTEAELDTSLAKLGLVAQGSGSSTTTTSAGLSMASTASASAAITAIDAALDKVFANRGDLGAFQNRLDHTVSNLRNVSENTAFSKSQIMDTDFATESANLAKAQVLQQAGTAMLAQANASGQSVLSLLK